VDLESAVASGPLRPSNHGHRLFTRTMLISTVFAVMLGMLFGVGLFTFGYGKGYSYLMSNPTTCTNCHVMQANYDSWEHSSHAHVAVCNDCHLPHDLLGHLLTEADNGFCHSLAFTLENFHEPIQIKARNRRVTQNACLHCHATTVHQMLPAEPSDEMPLCVHCHRDVGHAFR
jgi:cytochrome c nitrite reductase small subunit